MMAALEQQRRSRVLVLHGMHSSTAAFLPEAQALCASLHDLVECDGPPHDGMWWWPSVDHVRPDPRGALGWEMSYAELEPLLDAYDAVFGFSQGAAMAAVLCALHPTRVRFGIFACGFTAVGTGIPSLVEGDEALGAIDVPSFHIIGERDGAVPPEASQHLASRFKDPTVVTTSAGHWIQKNGDVLGALRAFLESLPAKLRLDEARGGPARRGKKKPRAKAPRSSARPRPRPAEGLPSPPPAPL